MYHLLSLWLLLTPNLVVSNIDRAFTLLQNSEWTAASAALDEAYADDPGLFAVNNLHYLRGRLAESQGDWQRALTEFEKVGMGNSLRPLAAWHAARALARLGELDRADRLLGELPSNFPADLKTQLALEAPPALALKIYGSLTSRLARLKTAELRNQTMAFWTLLRERNTDDVGLQSATKLAAVASTPQQLMDVANAFLVHRQFELARPLYERAAANPAVAAEARFQIARSYFLQQDYRNALKGYEVVRASFNDTTWQKDAAYQIANSHWRLRDHRNAETAYLDYIARYSETGVSESAIRDLVDVYRSLGEDSKAISLLDRTLAGRLTTAGRQVLLFSRAKTLYGQKQYVPALEIFRQLGRARLTAAANGSTREEVQYLEALTLSKLGNTAAAETIWKSLAADRSTYYGLKAAERLGIASDIKVSSRVCQAPVDAHFTTTLDRLSSRRRPVRSVPDPSAGAVAELIFLRLWDEASIWIERERQFDLRLAADLAYVSARYHRSIAHGDRLPKSEPTTLAALYPAGFRYNICEASSKDSVDPLWLHAIIWQESKYNPNAQSAASARGLMQFIPETAQAVAAEVGINSLTLDRLYDPVISIRLGSHYWADLMQEFKHPELALAAYNGGADNVRRWKDKVRDEDIDLFVSEIGFLETKRYVQAVFTARAAYGRLN